MSVLEIRTVVKAVFYFLNLFSRNGLQTFLAHVFFCFVRCVVLLSWHAALEAHEVSNYTVITVEANMKHPPRMCGMI